MQRLNKAKDARRRAHRASKKAIHVYGNAVTAARVIPDQRQKLKNRAEKHDAKFLD